MARVAAGETGAFHAVATRHAPALLRLARGYDPGLAADVVQDALVAALRAASTYAPERGEVRTWLLAITRNTARRAGRWRETSWDEAEDDSLLALGVDAGWGDAPDARLDAAADHEVLVHALAHLEVADREILLLRDVEGVSGPDAAEILGLGLAAQKSRLHRARLRLMAAVREIHGGLMANETTAGGLRCRDVLARLGDYVDGELPPAEVLAIDTHLHACDACARFGGRYAGTVAAARAKLDGDSGEGAVLDAVRRRLDAAR